MNKLTIVNNDTMELKYSQIQELERMIYQTKNNYYLQEEMQQNANRCAQEITDLNEKNSRNLETEKKKLRDMQEEHENERNHLTRKMQENKDRHGVEMSDLTDDFQNKLKISYE